MGGGGGSGERANGRVSSQAMEVEAEAEVEPAVLLFAIPRGRRVEEDGCTGEQVRGGEAGGGAGGAIAKAAAAGSPLFCFSALRHLAEDLAGVMHPEELDARELTAVSLDHRLMGSGGDDSWSACVHDEFLIRPGRFEFSFAVAPYWRGREGVGGEGGVLGGGERGGCGEQASGRWRELRKMLREGGGGGEGGSE